VEQWRIGFSFDRGGTKLDFDRVAMLADDLVDLRVWNDVKTKDSNNCSGGL
jgi:hypothetical protein